MRYAQRTQVASLLVRTCGSDDLGADPLRQLNRREADPARGAVHQHGLALLQAGDLHQPVIRGDECHHARARLQRDGVRQFEGTVRRDDHVGPEPIGAEGVDAIADGKARDVAADTGDSTGDLHSDTASGVCVLRDAVRYEAHGLEDVFVVQRNELGLDLHVVGADDAPRAGRKRDVVQRSSVLELERVRGFGRDRKRLQTPPALRL